MRSLASYPSDGHRCDGRRLVSPAQALEVRMREVQAILETVQNQRNELKQLYKVSAAGSTWALRKWSFSAVVAWEHWAVLVLPKPW